MTVKHLLFQTCQFIALLKLVQSHVLFAANLDDFRSMAKKIIPDHLADQITDMASQQMNYRQKSKHTINREESNEHLDEYIDKVKTGIVKVIKPSDLANTFKKKHAEEDNVQAIDFEELVDRVRQKIQAESENKHDDKPDSHTQKDDYIYDTEKKVRDSHKDNNYDYEETEKLQTKRTTRREREFYEELNREYDYNEKPQQPKATSKYSKLEYNYDAPELPIRNIKNQPEATSKSNKMEYYYDAPAQPKRNVKKQPEATTKPSKMEYYYDAPELPIQNLKKQPGATTKSSKMEYYYDAPELPIQNLKKQPGATTKSSKMEYYYDAPELPIQNDKKQHGATTKSSKMEYLYDAPDLSIQNVKKQPEVTAKSSKQEFYYDAPEPPSQIQNDNMFFQEANLANIKDSYEDYVTPKRDAVFESDSEMKTSRSVLKKEKLKSEEQRSYSRKPKTKSQNNPDSHYSELKHDQYKEVGSMVKHDKAAQKHSNVNQDRKEQDAAIPLLEDDDYYTEPKLEEVKAKTESLGNEPTQKGGTMKKLKGTMIPTRQRFKMSSPNYLVKIPVVAEKYDFNEPLPERDREPESLKHLPNPPARINHKVKL